MSMAISGMGGMMPPQAMTGASMRMPPSQKMSNLFQQIDTANTGSISKAQFNQAFSSMNPPKGFQQVGADGVWSKLDPNNTGSVSKQDFVNTMKEMMHQVRQHPVSPAETAAAGTSISPSLDAMNALSGGAIGSIIKTTA